MSMTSTLFPHDHEHAVALLQGFFGRRARALYESHGRSLAQLLQATSDSSDARMRLLARAWCIAQRAAAETAARADALTSPEAVTRFLKLWFAGQAFESFVVLYLDAANQVLAVEDLFRGTLTQTSVYPREIAKRALHHNAASIICSHCHPSGVCEPSKADQVLTHSLQRTLELVDVRVLDHIVVAGGAHMSFAQRGLL
jgi:DNA repair protein RadC